MKIIICGGGHVGSSIAQYLSEEYDIALIDTSLEVLSNLSEKMDLQTIHGSASDPDILKHAGAHQASALIATTGYDEINMVVCQMAYSLFQIPLKIARVRNQNLFKPEWSHLYHPDHLPIDVMISPETEVAKTISRNLNISHAFEVISLGGGRLRVIGIKIESKSPVLFTPLRHFHTLFPHLNIHILRISREQKIVPLLDTEELLPGDEVFFLTKTAQVFEAMAAFGYQEEIAQKIILLGGGNIGLLLAEEIEREHPELACTLIETDKEKSRFLVSQLKNSLVLQGDALDISILQEARVELTDIVIAVTNDDKVNILASLLAKHCGARRTITLMNQKGYIPHGIDKIINPSSLTISTILQRVRKGYIHTIHSLGENQGEIIEVEISVTSYATGLTVQEINNRKDIHIFAVLRQENILFPSSEFVLQVHDRVILIVAPDGFKKFKKFFEARAEEEHSD